MNGLLGLMLALLLPLLVGMGWVRRALPGEKVSVLVGYGYLTGVVIVVALLWFWGWFGLEFVFWQLVFILLALALVPVLVPRKGSVEEIVPMGESVASWQKALWWLLLLWLSIRFGGLLMEEVLRPLYPWDAWMNWAPRGKVWYELRHMVSFVGPAEWNEASHALGAYTLGNPQAVDYPPLIPLLLMWNALGLDEWRDNWINLSWGLCGLAFALGVYGQLRAMGHSALVVMLVISLIFTMPYLNTHVALAGYADLWVSAFFTLGVLALFRWCRTGEGSQLLLVIVMVAGCIMTKRPGVVWAVMLLIGMAMGGVPRNWRLQIAGAALLVLVAILFMGGVELEWNGQPIFVMTPDELALMGVGRFELSYHPVLDYFIKNYLVRDNWHLMGWLLLFSFPVAFWQGMRNAVLLPVALVMVVGVIFLIVVFFFTDHYKAAMDSTTINRATFHFLPSFALFSFIALFHDERER